MKSYIVCFEGNAESLGYEGFLEKLRDFSNKAEIFENIYIINTTKSATELRDLFSQDAPKGSRIFVIVTNRASAWKNILCDSSWLKENLITS